MKKRIAISIIVIMLFTLVVPLKNVFAEDMNREAILVLHTGDCLDDLTEEEFIIYDLLMFNGIINAPVNDINTVINVENGKKLFSVDEDTSMITLTEGLRSEDNIIYELSDDDKEFIKDSALNFDYDFVRLILWEDKAYNVTFDANEGVFTEDKLTIVVEQWEDSKLNSLEKPKKEGYEFLGFFTEKIGGTSLEKYIAEAGIDKDGLIFYAQWKQIEQIEMFEMSKNQEFIIEEDKTLIFYLNNDRGTGKVFINNQELSREKGDYVWNYVEGIYPTIHLSEEYMKTLEVGKYNIKFVLDDAKGAETTFTVSKQQIIDKENEINNSEEKINDAEEKIDDVEEKTDELENEKNVINNNLNNPQTGDNITLFVSILVISIIGIIFTKSCIKKDKKR